LRPGRRRHGGRTHTRCRCRCISCSRFRWCRSQGLNCITLH
jgi:hypothetical protein